MIFPGPNKKFVRDQTGATTGARRRLFRLGPSKERRQGGSLRIWRSFTFQFSLLLGYYVGTKVKEAFPICRMQKRGRRAEQAPGERGVSRLSSPGFAPAVS